MGFRAIPPPPAKQFSSHPLLSFYGDLTIPLQDLNNCALLEVPTGIFTMPLIPIQGKTLSTVSVVVVMVVIGMQQTS